VRLGTIQRDVLAFLSRNGGKGYIGSMTRAREFRGYDLEQVERSLASLIRRGVVRRVGICYELVT
jgi:DNA-binding MarR family transcriptional regulator